MTSTPVSDATLFFSNVGTKTQNVTGSSSKSESFSQVMNRVSADNVNVFSEKSSIKETSDVMNHDYQKNVNTESENNVSEKSTENINKSENDTKVDKTEETERPEEMVENVSEEACEELQEKAEELMSEIAKQFGVSKEDVEKVLEELGMNPMQLFNKENLMQVAVVLSGAEDVTQIVMDEELFAQVNELLSKMEGMLTEVSENTDVTVDELMEYISEESFENNLKVANEKKFVVEVENLVEDDGIEEDTLKFDQTKPVEKIDSEVKDAINVSAENSTEHSEHNMARSDAEPNNQFLTNVTNNQTVQNIALNAENSMNTYFSFEAREIMQQITEFIKVSVKPDMSSLQMQLNPEELGTLQIEITNKNGMVTAQFTTQDESVKTIIESQLIQLKENLNEQGVKVQAVEVTVASQQFDRNLDKNGRENTTQENGQNSPKKQIRRINLNELDVDLEEETDDAIRIAADMMARNGNTIDFMA